MKDFVVDVDLNNNDLINVDSVSFNTSTSDSPAVGKLVWDDGEGTLSYGVKGGNINLQVGSDLKLLCTNQTGSAIDKGKVVYINGASGNRPTIALADADVEATSSKTLGITAESINNGAEGFVATFGILTGLDTSAFTAGQALWLSSTAGGLTATPPAAPANSVFVGYAISINAVSGRIFVNVQNGYELGELHNVVLEADVNIGENEVLAYDATNDLWKNRTATEAGLIPSTIVDAKGDLIVATAADTVSRLAVGATNGHVLTIDSAEATGLKWAATASGASDLEALTDVDLEADIVVVNTSSVDANGATSATLNLPSSMQEGDLCFILIGNDGATAPDLPTGWKNLFTFTGDLGIRLCYKVMGSTVDTTASLTGLATGGSTAVSIAFRNAMIFPLSTTVVADSSTTTAGVPNPPSVTTTRANSIVLALGALVNESVSQANTTAPTNYTNLKVQNNASLSGMTTMLATRVISAAGSENPGTFTNSVSATDDWWAASIVVEPLNKNKQNSQVLVYNAGTSQWSNESLTDLYPQVMNNGLNGFKPGETYTSPATGNNSAQGPNTNWIYFIPFYVPVTATFDQISCYTASTWSGTTSTVRLGIYNSINGEPDTVNLDAGDVVCTAASTRYNIDIMHTLTPGWYWLAFWRRSFTGTTGTWSGNTVLLGWGYQRTNGSQNRINTREIQTLTGSPTTYLTASSMGSFANSQTVAAPFVFLRAL